jgi:hypothetical protein
VEGTARGFLTVMALVNPRASFGKSGYEVLRRYSGPDECGADALTNLVKSLLLRQ